MFNVIVTDMVNVLPAKSTSPQRNIAAFFNPLWNSPFPRELGAVSVEQLLAWPPSEPTLPSVVMMMMKLRKREPDHYLHLYTRTSTLKPAKTPEIMWRTCCAPSLKTQMSNSPFMGRSAWRPS